MATVQFDDINGPRPGVGRDQGLVALAAKTIAINLDPAGEEDTGIFSASGFVTFMLLGDPTGAPLRVSYVRVDPYSQVEFAAVELTTLDVGTEKRLTFGFRGEYLDDEVFAYFKLRFTNTDPGNPASFENGRLMASSF